MGSYAESCAVSGLPIRSGDKVLWFYAKTKVEIDHDLGDLVWRYDEAQQELKKMEEQNEKFRQRFPEEVNKLEWHDLNDLDFYRKLRPKEFEWGFGEYDDYGWVEGEKLPNKYFNYSFLVRKNVADKMAEYGKSLIDREWGGRNKYLKDNYLYCFLLVCHLTRIHLLGHRLLGRQSPDIDEMKERRFVHKVISEEIKLVSKEIMDEHKEYVAWCKEI